MIQHQKLQYRLQKTLSSSLPQRDTSEQIGLKKASVVNRGFIRVSSVPLKGGQSILYRHSAVSHCFLRFISGN